MKKLEELTIEQLEKIALSARNVGDLYRRKIDILSVLVNHAKDMARRYYGQANEAKKVIEAKKEAEK